MIKEQDNDKDESKSDRPMSVDKMMIVAGPDENDKSKQQQQHLNVPLGISAVSRKHHRSDTNLAIDTTVDQDSLDRRKALSINKDFHTYKYIGRQKESGENIWPSSSLHAKSAGKAATVDLTEQTVLKTNWIEKLKVIFTAIVLWCVPAACGRQRTVLCASLLNRRV